MVSTLAKVTLRVSASISRKEASATVDDGRVADGVGLGGAGDGGHFFFLALYSAVNTRRLGRSARGPMTPIINGPIGRSHRHRDKLLLTPVGKKDSIVVSHHSPDAQGSPENQTRSATPTTRAWTRHDANKEAGQGRRVRTPCGQLNPHAGHM